MTISTFGLVLFVLVVAVTAPVLIVDGIRYLMGLTTLTQYVRQECRKHRWLGWLLVGLVLLGPLGLALHFFA